MKQDITALKNTAQTMRKQILQLGFAAGNNGAHFAPALSIAEICAALYCNVMHIDTADFTNSDHFILSKGHGSLANYTAMHAAGLLDEATLTRFEENGGPLPGQPSKNLALGIECSSGSLGMGLAYGMGLALADSRKNNSRQTYVLLGDGECNEGSVWEAAQFAAHQKMTNITAIIDANHMQSDGDAAHILNNNPAAMWQGFGWQVITADGHSFDSLLAAFDTKSDGRPRVIVAATVKGKGVSFMENAREWHHGRLTQQQLDEALAQVTGGQTLC
ncbi:MAG: transketolase [Oscillospiraceae bacterium]|nr:transketolase [Oscillospiraceae bacterium]